MNSKVTLLARLSIFLVGFVLVSCAQDVANRYYVSEKFPEKPVDQVDLLTSKPSRPFNVIADFQSRNETPAAIRKKAAKIGADAVIVTTLGGSYAFSDQWVNQDSQKNTYSRIIGTAIRYK